MVQVPFFLAFTTPPALIEATFGLLEDQLSVLFVALLGLIVALSVYFFPAVIVSFVVLSLTLVTATVFFFTVTLQVAVLPLLDFTVIVQVPAALALITPPDETVATFELLDDQVTFLFVALEGVIVAFKVYFVPAVIVTAVAFSLIPVTATVGFFTVTLQVAVLPLFDFAVIVQVPAALALITPPEPIEATFGLLDDQVIVLFVAVLGVIVAFKVYFVPAVIVTAVVLSLTLVTAVVFA